MNYWVPFIGYSAFFLGDDNRVHAGYDFVGEAQKYSANALMN